VKSLPVDEARNDLESLINEVRSEHEPIEIRGQDSAAILLSEDDWRSILETLYLVSIPGMRESVRQGLRTPLDECSEKLDW